MPNLFVSLDKIKVLDTEFFEIADEDLNLDVRIGQNVMVKFRDGEPEVDASVVDGNFSEPSTVWRFKLKPCCSGVLSGPETGTEPLDRRVRDGLIVPGVYLAEGAIPQLYTLDGAGQWWSWNTVSRTWAKMPFKVTDLGNWVRLTRSREEVEE